MTKSTYDNMLALWRTAANMTETGVRMVEMGHASAEVVASRTRTIAEAGRDPLHADHCELGRMMPEKVDAFGRAWLSLWSDMAAVQADTQAGLLQATRAAMTGTMFGAAHLAASNDRMLRIAERSLGAGGRALAPVHARATGNAARLRRKRANGAARAA